MEALSIPEPSSEYHGPLMDASGWNPQQDEPIDPGEMGEMEMQHWEAAGYEFAGRSEPYDGSEDSPFVHDPDFQLPEGF